MVALWRDGSVQARQGAGFLIPYRDLKPAAGRKGVATSPRESGKNENSHATALRVKRSPKAMLRRLAANTPAGEAKGTIRPPSDRPDPS